MRVEIPVYTDRWMMGDRFGEVISVSRGGFTGRRSEMEEIAHVKLDKSGKTVRVVLADCKDVT